MANDPGEACSTSDTKTCLSRGQSIGLSLTAEAGLISILSLLVLFILLARNVYRNSQRPAIERRRLIQEPADVLVLSLFVADLLQAIGAAMDARWANEGFVQVGGFCTAQGAIQQLGETTVAMNTLVIALQTFIAIWFRKFVHNMIPAYACVAFIWVFVIIFVAVGAGVHGGTTYYTPTPYWCWIGSQFSGERIAGEYFWLWLTLFVSVIVYVPIFLWSQGFITVDKTHWWKVQIHLTARISSEEENARDRPEPLSLAILGYPAVYSVIILPLSVVRWITFSKQHSSVPSAATFAVVFLFGLSGFANVVLLLTTRPNLLLFDSDWELRPRPNANGARLDDDVEMAHVIGGEGAPAGTGASTGTYTRGRPGRRRTHDQGRIATPSRSSSRAPSERVPADNLFPTYAAPRGHGRELSSDMSEPGALRVEHERDPPHRLSTGTGTLTHSSYGPPSQAGASGSSDLRNDDESFPETVPGRSAAFGQVRYTS